MLLQSYCSTNERSGTSSQDSDEGSSEESTESNIAGIYDVVVIGAGIAGIAAATELYSTESVRSIVVLEARDRIGGRIHTERTGEGRDDFFEIGAQYVHGEAGNPLFTYLEQNNLKLPETDMPKRKDVWFNMNGKEIPLKVAEEVKDFYFWIRENLDETSGVTIGDQLKMEFTNWLLSKSPDGYEESKAAVFNFLYKYDCLDVAEDYVNVSTYEDSDYNITSGELEGYVIGGWGRVVESLLEKSKFPTTSNIRLNSVVKKICWNCSDSNKVAVHLDDGRVIYGKKAISTLPIGVLKARTVTFDPELPIWKQGSVDRIGYGCIVKMNMFFKNAWWGRNTEMNALFQSSIQDDIKVSRHLYDNDAQAQWYRHLVVFNSVYGDRNILQGWIYGEHAMLVETLPLEEVTSIINQILKNAFSKTFPVEYPYLILRSDWCTNPYSLGAYSYVSLTSRGSDFRRVFEPLPKSDDGNKAVLFFAGEGAADEQWSSVHGAYSTGIKAAKLVAEQLKKY